MQAKIVIPLFKCAASRQVVFCFQKLDGVGGAHGAGHVLKNMGLLISLPDLGISIAAARVLC